MSAWYLIAGGRGETGRRLSGAVRAAALRHHPGLVAVHETDDVLLLADGPVTVWPSAGPPRLFLLGEVIPQASFGPQRAAPLTLAMPADACADAIADRLVERIWGRYVAILLDDAHPVLLAEPSGAAPVALLEAGAGTIASGDLPRWLWAAAGVRPALREDALGLALIDPVLATDRALLHQAVIVPPGATRRLGGGPIRLAFSPAALAARPCEAVDRAALAATLAATIDATIAAHGPGPFVVQASGGLDSSIVLASLRRGGARATAMTVASGHAGGDERGWARLVADHLGVALVEHVSGPRPIDHARLATIAHGLRPCLAGLDDGFEAALAATATATGACAILTGQGGDDLFGGLAEPSVTADRVRALGLRGLAHAALLADAERSDRSIWAILAAVLGDALRVPRRPRPPTMPAFLSEALRARSRGRPRHVWRTGDQGLPPAKRLQIAHLANAQIHFMPRPGAQTVPTLHPLLAQPILTLALRMPFSQLAFGPQDRALARLAFADRLPPATLARRLKGEASHHYSRALRDDLAALRSLILDGPLPGLGLIDRATAEQVLRADHLAHSLDFRGVAVTASLSAWAHYWR